MEMHIKEVSCRISGWTIIAFYGYRLREALYFNIQVISDINSELGINKNKSVYFNINKGRDFN